MEADRDVEKFMELLDKKIHEAKEMLLERYHYISIWYDHIVIYPGALLDHDISLMINKMFRNDMLSPNILKNVDIAHDYTTCRYYNGEIDHDTYLQYMQRISKKS